MFVRTVLHLDAQALAFCHRCAAAPGRRRPISSVWSSTATARRSTPSPRDSTSRSRTPRPSRRSRTASCTPRACRSRKPGGYQLRYAVRDRRSGAIGSAGGFVNVPDVTGGAFALSGLVLRAGERTAASESIDSDRFSVRPADALRVYAPGTQLSYSYEIYNAGTAVQAVTSLWRGADRLTSLPPDTLVPPADGGPLVDSRWPQARRRSARGHVRAADRRDIRRSEAGEENPRSRAAALVRRQVGIVDVSGHGSGSATIRAADLTALDSDCHDHR